MNYGAFERNENEVEVIKRVRNEMENCSSKCVYVTLSSMHENINLTYLLG